LSPEAAVAVVVFPLELMEAHMAAAEEPAVCKLKLMKLKVL
jgi:hypothetical protein